MDSKKTLKIVTDESARTKNDLQQSDPEKSLNNFYKRHGQIVSAILNTNKHNIACQEKCSYCCYFKVEVKTLEIITIVKFVEKNFTGEKTHALLKKAQENIAEFENLNYETQVATNQACPFLDDNSCSIYEVRPGKCRNNHATDVNLCKACYDNPADNSIPSSYYKPLQLALNALTRGFEAAFKDTKYDMASYDINNALIAAFNNKKFIKRYLKGKKSLV